jgi:sRNA-binding carbon storage regulator CsrA
MLNLVQKEGGTIIIDHMEGLDPTMTVVDLFREGPITIQARKAKGRGKIQVEIDAPQGLRVMRGELVGAGQQ